MQRGLCYKTDGQIKINKGKIAFLKSSANAPGHVDAVLLGELIAVLWGQTGVGKHADLVGDVVLWERRWLGEGAEASDPSFGCVRDK